MTIEELKSLFYQRFGNEGLQALVLLFFVKKE